MITSPIEFSFLHGLHTADTVLELVEKLAVADVILIECVTIRSMVPRILHIMNSLSVDPAYVEEFSHYRDTVDDTLLKSDQLSSIAWELRLQGKAYDLIDVKVDDEKTFEAELLKLAPFTDMDEVFTKIVANPELRYELMDAAVTRTVQTIQSRDRLVLRQLAPYAEHPLDTPAKRYLETNGHCHIAVVQGYLHRLLPLFKSKYPHIPVHDYLYGETALSSLIKGPVHLLLEEKLKRPLSDPLTHKLIDYALYKEILAVKNGTIAASGESTLEVVAKAQAEGVANTNLATQLTMGREDSPDNYTEAQLGVKVEALLREVSGNGAARS